MPETKTAANKDRSWIPATLLQPGTKWRRKLPWDADDTVFTFREELAAYILQHRGIDVAGSGYYDYSLDPALAYTRAQFEDDLLAFARFSHGSYDTRRLRPGVKKAMKLLEQHGVTNCLWTAAPGTNDHIAWAGRRHWTAFPQEATFKLIADTKLPIATHNVKFIAAHQKASEMDEGHYPAIVDDFPVTIIEVATRGLLGFLVDQPYNQAVTAPGIIRVQDPLAVAGMVIELFDQLEKLHLIADR